MNLSIIKEFCKKNWEAGKIINVEFDFPSFSIGANEFKSAVLDTVSDSVRLGLLINSYKNEDIIPNTSYEDLLEAEQAKLQNQETPKQKGMNLYCEKVLSVFMEKDSAFNCTNINRNALNTVCSDSMLTKLAQLEYSRTYCAAYKESASEFAVEKDKFVATLIMMKNKIPSVYKYVENGLNDAVYAEIVSDLRAMEKRPDIAVINQIYKVDSKLASELFPKDVQRLQNLSSVENTMNKLK